MACAKKHGVQEALTVISEHSGVKITDSKYHELRDLAKDLGYEGGRGKLKHTDVWEENLNKIVDPSGQSVINREEYDTAPGGDLTENDAMVFQLLADKGLEDALKEATGHAKAKRSEADGPKSTGKEGTDVPPLVAEIKSGRNSYRFYAIDPETKDQLESGFLSVDDALNSGKAFPSITTCLGTLDKPALVPWAAGLSAGYGEEKLRELQSMNEDERNAALEEMLSAHPTKNNKSNFAAEATDVYNLRRDEAAVRGTEVHALAEALSKGENPEIPDELSGYTDAAKEFLDTYPEMKFVYTEATVLNKEARTMGTTDAIVEYKGKRYVLDYKTNKDGNVYSSTGMQLSAAANADHIVHSDGTQEEMPEIHGGIGIGFSPKGKFKVYKFETDRDGANFKGFKAAREAWDHKFSPSGKTPRVASPDDF